MNRMMAYSLELILIPLILKKQYDQMVWRNILQIQYMPMMVIHLHARILDEM